MNFVIFVPQMLAFLIETQLCTI